MKIVHLLHEFPFPPTSGIRCDMGRRLAAFKTLGHSVFAVAWHKAAERPSSARLQELNDIADQTVLLTIGSDLKSRARRVWNMRRHPSSIAARIPETRFRDNLLEQIDVFRPDLVWLEGVHPSWLALDISNALKVPLAYRAHNVEYRYLAEQARLARNIRLKVAVKAATWGLERAERELHKSASRVFDISAEDLGYWRDEGYTNNEWLAPQPDLTLLRSSLYPSRERDIDLLFLGGLASPNNVAGLRWFFDCVYPQIRTALPDVALVIAGRAPAPDLVATCEANHVTLVIDPPVASDLFSRARVMINPILHGSGVNIKTIDMLATGQPVITTTKGARGLPHEIVAELEIGDGPNDFAKSAIASVQRMRTGAILSSRSALIDRVFGIHGVARALARFE